MSDIDPNRWSAGGVLEGEYYPPANCKSGFYYFKSGVQPLIINEEDWTPLTDKNQLFMVMEKMRELGFNFNLNWQAHPGITICLAQFHKISPFVHGQGANDDPNTAVLQAAREVLCAFPRNRRIT